MVSGAMAAAAAIERVDAFETAAQTFGSVADQRRFADAADAVNDDGAMVLREQPVAYLAVFAAATVKTETQLRRRISSRPHR